MDSELQKLQELNDKHYKEWLRCLTAQFKAVKALPETKAMNRAKAKFLKSKEALKKLRGW